MGAFPEKISHRQFWATERVTKKFTFFAILCTATERKAAGSCTLNFDATNLPHSSFEPLYPEDFRGAPNVDVV